jgi:hypothetical protein
MPSTALIFLSRQSLCATNPCKADRRIPNKSSRTESLSRHPIQLSFGCALSPNTPDKAQKQAIQINVHIETSKRRRISASLSRIIHFHVLPITVRVLSPDIEVLLEGKLAGIDLVTAQVFHPAVVANQQLLDAILSRILESFVLHRPGRALAVASSCGIWLEEVLNTTTAIWFGGDELHSIRGWANRHRDLVNVFCLSDSIIREEVLHLCETVLKVGNSDAGGIDFLGRLNIQVRSNVTAPALDAVQVVEVESWIVFLKETDKSLPGSGILVIGLAHVRLKNKIGIGSLIERPRVMEAIYTHTGDWTDHAILPHTNETLQQWKKLT